MPSAKRGARREPVGPSPDRLRVRSGQLHKHPDDAKKERAPFGEMLVGNAGAALGHVEDSSALGGRTLCYSIEARLFSGRELTRTFGNV